MTRPDESATAIASILATAASLLGNHAGPVAYMPGSTGYDVSHPQCGGNFPAGAFGIVGVNGGTPLHYNPCLAAEYAHSANAAVYVNTGYDPLYAQVDDHYTTKGCLAKSGLIHGSAEQKTAWAVGCSEASRSIAYAASQGITKPSGWWLDVETENSWSSMDLSLNQYAARVLSIRCVAPREQPSASTQPVTSGGRSQAACRSPAPGPTGWAPGVPPREMCPPLRDRFSGAPIWFVHYLHGGFDTNYVG